MMKTVPQFDKTEAVSIHASVMEDCDAKLNQIADFVPHGSSIFYIDYPMHTNIGDLLINMGAEAFFKRSNYDVKGRICYFDICDCPDMDLNRLTLREDILGILLKQSKDTIFLFHGGGNFGDLYPELNLMRQMLISHLFNYRVIVLPQSIHFSSADIERECLESVLKHPDLHIFVRDTPSLDAIRRVAPEAGILCSDMAHALWPIFEGYRNQIPSNKKLRLARRDAETTGEIGSDTDKAIDWDDLLTSFDNIAHRILRKLHHTAIFGFDAASSYAGWYRFRDKISYRAIRHFTKYELIETDRMHGMILASLLQRSCIFLDNSYGKLSRYHNQWLLRSPLITQHRN